MFNFRQVRNIYYYLNVIINVLEDIVQKKWGIILIISVQGFPNTAGAFFITAYFSLSRVLEILYIFLVDNSLDKMRDKP
ncbi:MAG: hypothetical protein ACOC5A_03045 [Halanaerobiales bacterium]